LVPDLTASSPPGARGGDATTHYPSCLALKRPGVAPRYPRLVIRIGILSFWHVHARDYARDAEANPSTQITAVWDEDPERGRREAEARGVRFHADLDAILGAPDVDAVVVTTPTSAHRDVITAAARAGKHIFTEKVLAATPAECREIMDAVEASGVRLTVSLPRMADAYTLAIRDVLAQGQLGDVTLARVRLSHDGALGEGWLPPQFYDPDEARGGALIDLGCHPMYLTRTFLGGMPQTVAATFGRVTARKVEDNAVALLGYADGSLGVVEAGFVNRHSPFTIEVHGTEGSLLYGTPEARLLIRSGAKRGDGAWTELPLPPAAPSLFDQWVTHIQQGTTATENIALAFELTTLMDAANRSATTGQTIRLGGPNG
jgi:1,5-anhydro-D-fructose reductase (1,5-anhydro-D-mannitol-forming)